MQLWLHISLGANLEHNFYDVPKVTGEFTVVVLIIVCAREKKNSGRHIFGKIIVHVH